MVRVLIFQQEAPRTMKCSEVSSKRLKRARGRGYAQLPELCQGSLWGDFKQALRAAGSLSRKLRSREAGSIASFLEQFLCLCGVLNVAGGRVAGPEDVCAFNL